MNVRIEKSNFKGGVYLVVETANGFASELVREAEVEAILLGHKCRVCGVPSRLPHAHTNESAVPVLEWTPEQIEKSKELISILNVPGLHGGAKIFGIEGLMLKK